MGKLPVVSGRAARRAFERAGWAFSRQPHDPGARRFPRRARGARQRELETGLLRGLIRDAGLSVDEFLGLLG